MKSIIVLLVEKAIVEGLALFAHGVGRRGRFYTLPHSALKHFSNNCTIKITIENINRPFWLFNQECVVISVFVESLVCADVQCVYGNKETNAFVLLPKSSSINLSSLLCGSQIPKNKVVGVSNPYSFPVRSLFSA